MNQLVLDRSNLYFSLFPDHLSYIDSCLEAASYKLKDYDNISDFENDLANINAYDSMIQFLKIDMERSYQLLSPC